MLYVHELHPFCILCIYVALANKGEDIAQFQVFLPQSSILNVVAFSLLSVGTLKADNDTSSITEPSNAPDGRGESSQNVTGCSVHCEQKNDSKIEVEPPESNPPSYSK